MGQIHRYITTFKALLSQADTTSGFSKISPIRPTCSLSLLVIGFIDTDGIDPKRARPGTNLVDEEEKVANFLTRKGCPFSGIGRLPLGQQCDTFSLAVRSIYFVTEPT